MRGLRVAAAAALLVAGCAPATPAPAPDLDWQPCGDGLHCATVAVPLDWSVPGGATVELALARYPATTDRAGTVFFNPGGPGVAGVEVLRARSAQLSTLGGGHFDVVSWDPRGTGIRCSTSYAAAPLPSDRAAAALHNTRAAEFAAQCGADTGDLLAHVTTAATARDLDRLRTVVGDPQLNFYGESYGSFLGQTYANLFPDRVRAMVLDGIVDPIVYTAGAEERIANTMTDTSAVFAAFARLCQAAGPHRCALAESRAPAEVLTDVLGRLAAGPLPATSGQLTYGDALMALYSYLSDPQTWPELARGLAAAAAGDGSALLERARPLRSGLVDAIPPAAGIACADSPAHVARSTWEARLDQFTALNPIYGPLLTWWLWAPCAAWPVNGAEVYAGPWGATTAHPVLVIGTTADPNTPYRNARTVATLLGNAVLLTHEGYGHVSVSDPSVCVEKAVAAYLVSLQPPADGARCPSDRLPFDPAFGQ